MTLRHIKIFIEIYRSGSVTQAAKQLHMTQPAVTRALKELENYYGICLFERIGRRLSVSPAGQALYPQALHIADTFDHLEKGLQNWDTFGVLRVGASITLGNFFLPEAALALRALRPNLKLHATISNGASIEQALCENLLDVAMIEGRVTQAQLVREPFAQDQLVLILPPDHPLCAYEALRMEQLSACDFLLREPGSAGRTFLEHVFAAHAMTLQPVWESASTQALVKAVHAGLGVSLLPRQLVQADLSAKTVVSRPVLDEPFARTHFLVWHKDKFLTGSAQIFLRLCRELAAKSEQNAAPAGNKIPDGRR